MNANGSCIQNFDSNASGSSSRPKTELTSKEDFTAAPFRDSGENPSAVVANRQAMIERDLNILPEFLETRYHDNAIER